MQAIQKVLTEEEWQLLRRVTLERASYKTVSKELGLTVWTCQKRVQRIREKLRAALQEYF